MWKILRKRNIVVAVALLIVVSLGWLWLTPTDKPEIRGDIPPADVAEIERVAQRNIWQGSLPNFSWYSIKQFPTEVYYRMHVHVLAIISLEHTNLPTQVDVWIGRRKKGLDAISGATDFFLHKTSKGWE